MLPSSGYFKNIICPFFKVGLCCRPHCHYKHVKSEISERQPFVSIVQENEPLLDTDNSTNLFQELLHSSTTPSIRIVETQQNPTYIPTPVNRTGPVKLTGILKDNRTFDKPSTSSVPEYKPTPITKLHAPHIKRQYNDGYSPEHSGIGRKKKKVEEYDPTEVKCAKKKRVSFAIPSDSGEVDHVMPDSNIESSEESDDEDISGDVPKFSDDDLDNDDASDTLVQMKEDTAGKIDGESEMEGDFNDETEDLLNSKKEISEFSIVDKIIVDSKVNEQLLAVRAVKTVTEKGSAAARLVKKLGGKKPCDKQIKLNSGEVVKGTKSPYDELLDKIISNGGDLEMYSVESKSLDKVNNLLLNKESEVNNFKSDSGVSDKEKLNISNSVIDDNKKCSDLKTKSSKEKCDQAEKVIESSKCNEITDKKKHKEKSNKKLKEKAMKKVEISNENSKHKEKSCKKEHCEKSKENSKHKESSGKKDKKNPSYSSSKKSSSKEKHDKVPSHKTDKKRTENKIQDGMVSSSCVTTKKEKSHKSEKSNSSKKSEKCKTSTDSSESINKKSKSKSKVTDDILFSEPSKIKSLNEDKKGMVDSDNDCIVNNDFDNEVVSLSSDSERDEEECWKIYNETYPNPVESSTNSKHAQDKSSQKKEQPGLVILGKKRLAHEGAEALRKPKTSAEQPEAKKLNPVQIMHNRYAQLRAMYAKKNDDKTVNGNIQRKLIANMPNYSLIEAVKQKNEFSKYTSNPKELSGPSLMQVNLKAGKRVAHIPLVALKPRPIIPADCGSRVPTNVRQKFLNTFINECLKFCLTEEQAYEMGLDEEKRAYDRSTSKAIYMNVASNAVSRLRHRAEAGPQTDTSTTDVSSTSSIKSQGKTVSHESILVGPRASKGSFSIERKKPKNVDLELKGLALYNYLLSFALTEEQLVENGFPMMHPTEPGRAVCNGFRKSNYCNDAFKRTCTRCAKVYYVNTEGNYVKDEECDFHWGHLWKRRIAGAIESRYSCCQGDSESEGCCVGSGHVFEGSEAHALKGFVQTLMKSPPPDKYYGVYALDCEMCYTTAGIELTRLTVIDPNLSVVFESFVKPQNEVLDYNTRFSGITEEDLKNVRTSLRDVQAVLLCIFNERTILIGHSLESDFKALKLFHKTVVDTSVVFPHKLGLPFKRSLKTLMAEKLNKIIQNNVGGHDSNEDAVACMDLMIWKIKEDLKSSR